MGFFTCKCLLCCQKRGIVSLWVLLPVSVSYIHGLSWHLLLLLPISVQKKPKPSNKHLFITIQLNISLFKQNDSVVLRTILCFIKVFRPAIKLALQLNLSVVLATVYLITEFIKIWHGENNTDFSINEVSM